MLRLSFVCLYVFTVPALSADEALKPKHTLDPSHRSTLYYTEVMIPDGKQFDVSCPRERPFDKSDAYKKVSILSGRFSSDFASKGTATCKDTVITKDLAAQCKDKSQCTIAAQDLSTEEGCSKRTLRLRFHCRNPADRAVLISLIVDK